MHPTYHKRVTFDLAASSALLLSTHEGRSRPSVFLVRQSCALDCDLGSTTTKRLDCDLGSTTTKRGKSTLLHASWTGSGSPQLAKRHVMRHPNKCPSPLQPRRETMAHDGTEVHGSFEVETSDTSVARLTSSGCQDQPVKRENDSLREPQAVPAGGRKMSW